MTTATQPMSWVMPWGQLQWLQQLNPAVARKFFNVPTSFVVGSNPFPGTPPYYSCGVLPLFDSIHDYNAAGGTMMGSKFPWVCYDPENWAKTQEIEKRHIKLSLWAFTDLAHARGQKVVLAPSRDIIYAKAADEPWQWPETIDAGYLRVGIPLAAANAGAETFIVQAQGDEKDPAAYAALVQASAQQVGPNVTLWSELTTNLATGAQMKAAYDAANASGAPVAGYWVSIMAQSQAQVAVDFFNLLP